MASRKQSALWGGINLVVGFVVSFLAHLLLVSVAIDWYITNMDGEQTAWEVALAVTVFYTFLSFARFYVLDRAREYWKRRKGIVDIDD